LCSVLRAGNHDPESLGCGGAGQGTIGGDEIAVAGPFARENQRRGEQKRIRRATPSSRW
jgi:hypothetical protein